jgi:transposase-like protein
MVSKDPFNIAQSPQVAPITCIACGNNMRCVRRSPGRSGESQAFVCAVCGRSFERTVGLQVGDAAIQVEVENSLGITRKSG